MVCVHLFILERNVTANQYEGVQTDDLYSVVKHLHPVNSAHTQGIKDGGMV